jgi:hypothetical protein
LSRDEGGAIAKVFGNLTLTHCAIHQNSAADDSGAIYNLADDLRLHHCTIANNAGPFRSTIYNDTGNLYLTHCTIIGNTSLRSALSDDGQTTITNTVIAGNHTFPALPETSPDTTENSPVLNGVNFIGVLPSPLVASPSLLTGDPRLAPIGDYGGRTPIALPLPDSPLIGAATVLAGVDTDQRGFPRDAMPDLGAAEYQGRADLDRLWPLDLDGDGKPYGVERAIGTDPLVVDPAAAGNFLLNSETDNAPAPHFGIGADAEPGTSWVLHRSFDLIGFEEVFRFDGAVATFDPNDVTPTVNADSISVVDQDQTAAGAFYRLEATLAPLP